MRQVSVEEAAERLYALLDEVESGHTVVIVRSGNAIARLVPAPRPSP